MGVNKVILLGNAGKDPELKYAPNGSALARFTLATSEPAYTTAEGVSVPEVTEWHNILMWGKNAELAEKYVRKGSKLYIEGRLRTRRWEDKNAIQRNVTEIVVDRFEILARPQP